MRFIKNATGAIQPYIQEFIVSTSADISKGTIMALSEGASAVISSTSSVIIGSLEEDYKITTDILNPRNGKGKVKINATSGGIYAVAAAEYAASSGSATTFVPSAAVFSSLANDDFNGGYLILSEKAENSTNTDEIGAVRKITDFTAGTKTFTLESGGSVNAGDKYLLIPPIGYNKLGYSSDTKSFAPSATQSFATVVGFDFAEKEYHVTLKQGLIN